MPRRVILAVAAICVGMLEGAGAITVDFEDMPSDNVEIVVFTTSGGLYRLTFTLEKVFPQTLVSVADDNLAECDCAVPY